MRNKTVRELILSGLFISLGVVLPIAFHALGTGPTFLPMHIPILIAGFVLSLPYAIIVGAVTPLLSSFLTGMPPIFPVLPYMVVELAAYGGVVSLLYRKFRQNIYITLICSMVLGRIVAGITVWFLATFFMAKLPGPVMFIMGAITQGLPGIVLQLLLIPVIVFALEKSNLIKKEGISA